eukprot:TRINITY_DN11042_c0_g1_i1.p1 TRINITY_DN11042_c0_g1~~TRINITY_DN11042_c0_g1_i1.p1  ORF type:complete len:1325 (+),score=317.56 TRINITY_DN11042_c0_g1_i1:49-4023(+)
MMAAERRNVQTRWVIVVGALVTQAVLGLAGATNETRVGLANATAHPSSTNSSGAAIADARNSGAAPNSSEAPFARSRTARPSRAGPSAAATRAAASALSAFDSDRDGRLDAAEFHRMMKVAVLPRKDRASFSREDSDRLLPRSNRSRGVSGVQLARQFETAPADELLRIEADIARVVQSPAPTPAPTPPTAPPSPPPTTDAQPQRSSIIQEPPAPRSSPSTAASPPRSHEFEQTSAEIQRYRETVAEQSKQLQRFRDIATRLETALQARDRSAAQVAAADDSLMDTTDGCPDSTTAAELSTLTEMCLRQLPPERWASFSRRELSTVGAGVLSALRAEQLRGIAEGSAGCGALAPVLPALHGEQCALLPASCASVLTEESLRQLRWNCFTHFNEALAAAMEPEQLAAVPVVGWLGAPRQLLAALSPPQCAALTAEAAGALRACGGFSSHCLRALRPTALAALKPRCVRRLRAEALRDLGNVAYALRQDALAVLQPEQIAVLGQECDVFEAPAVSGLSREQCASMRVHCFRALRHTGALSAACVAGLAPATVGAAGARHVRALRPQSMAALGPKQAKRLSARACEALSAAQVRGVGGDTCLQLRETCAQHAAARVLSSCNDAAPPARLSQAAPAGAVPALPSEAYAAYSAAASTPVHHPSTPRPESSYGFPTHPTEYRPAEYAVVTRPPVVVPAATRSPYAALRVVVERAVRDAIGGALDQARVRASPERSERSPPDPKPVAASATRHVGRVNRRHAASQDSVSFVDGSGTRYEFRLGKHGVLWYHMFGRDGSNRQRVDSLVFTAHTRELDAAGWRVTFPASADHDDALPELLLSLARLADGAGIPHNLDDTVSFVDTEGDSGQFSFHDGSMWYMTSQMQRSRVRQLRWSAETQVLEAGGWRMTLAERGNPLRTLLARIAAIADKANVPHTLSDWITFVDEDGDECTFVADRRALWYEGAQQKRRLRVGKLHWDPASQELDAAGWRMKLPQSGTELRELLRRLARLAEKAGVWQNLHGVVEFVAADGETAQFRSMDGALWCIPAPQESHVKVDRIRWLPHRGELEVSGWRVGVTELDRGSVLPALARLADRLSVPHNLPVGLPKATPRPAAVRAIRTPRPAPAPSVQKGPPTVQELLSRPCQELEKRYPLFRPNEAMRRDWGPQAPQKLREFIAERRKRGDFGAEAQTADRADSAAHAEDDLKRGQADVAPLNAHMATRMSLSATHGASDAGAGAAVVSDSVTPSPVATPHPPSPQQIAILGQLRALEAAARVQPLNARQRQQQLVLQYQLRRLQQQQDFRSPWPGIVVVAVTIAAVSVVVATKKR